MFSYVFFETSLKNQFKTAVYFVGIWEYIEQTREMVHTLERNVQSTKTNVEAMNTLMSKWSVSALYDRKDGKKDTLLNIEVGVLFSL